MEVEMQEKEIVNYFKQQAREGKTAEEAIYALFEVFGAEDKMPEFANESSVESAVEKNAE